MAIRSLGNYYTALLSSDVQKAVNVTFTGSSRTVIWTPAAGRSFHLKGWNLRCSVGLLLVGATPGARISFFDAAALMPFVLGSVVAAGDAPGVNYGQSQQPTFEGILSAAPNNTLLVGIADGTIGGGTIVVSGYVWGSED